MILGRRDVSNYWSLYTFQNNSDEELVETWIDAPCQHGPLIKSFITVVWNWKELLAVLCSMCTNIKLVDDETKQAALVFKFPTKESPWSMCPGPDGGLFVAFHTKKIQQLDSSFNIANTFNVGKWSPIGIKNYCSVDYNIFTITPVHYLPAPHDTLVINKKSEVRCISLQRGHHVWRWKCKEYKQPNNMLFCQQQDLLLLSEWFGCQIRILNLSNGVILQTIEIPNIYSIHRMCLYNDQILMIERPEKESNHHLLSYYDLER